MQVNASVALVVFLLGASIGALLALLCYAGLRERIRNEFTEELHCALYPKYRQHGKHVIRVDTPPSAKRDTQPDALSPTLWKHAVPTRTHRLNESLDALEEESAFTSK